MDASSSQPAGDAGSAAAAAAAAAPLANVWLVVTLALLLVSLIGCLCSFFFYYKMSYWRRTATVYPMVGPPTASSVSVASSANELSLPNYTLVSGLPSYDAALAEYQKAHFYMTYTGRYFTYSGGVRTKRGSIKELLENCKLRASPTIEPGQVPETAAVVGRVDETLV